MLFSTLIQPTAFLNMSIFGFCTGSMFLILTNFTKKTKKMRFFYHFFNFFIYTFVFLSFLYSNLLFNFGEYRAFSFIAFFLSFFISFFFVSKILETFFIKCYNKAKVKFNEKIRSSKKI